MFDTRSMLAALERPRFIDAEGVETIGVPLSHVQYYQVLADLKAAGSDEKKADEVMRGALTIMQLPAEAILALPDPLYVAAVRDFFRCCRGEKNGANPATSSPKIETPSTPA